MWFVTDIDDIQKWIKTKRFDKIIKALSYKDPSIRGAAAKALCRMDINYTGGRLIKSALNALILRLNDDDRNVIKEAAYSLWYLYDPSVSHHVELMINILNSTKDVNLSKDILNELVHSQEVNNRNAQESLCLNIFRIIKKNPKLSSELVDLLISEVARIYINHSWLNKDSLLGQAFADFGPIAGNRLILVADEKFCGASSAARDAAREFGKRIIEGKECGFHNFDKNCRCIKCGKRHIYVSVKGDKVRDDDSGGDCYYYINTYKCRICGNTSNSNDTEILEQKKSKSTNGNVSSKTLKIFSEDEISIGAECPNCGKVLKVLKQNTNKTNDGYELRQPVICFCKYIYSKISGSNKRP